MTPPRKPHRTVRVSIASRKRNKRNQQQQQQQHQPHRMRCGAAKTEQGMTPHARTHTLKVYGCSRAAAAAASVICPAVEFWVSQFRLRFPLGESRTHGMPFGGNLRPGPPSRFCPGIVITVRDADGGRADARLPNAAAIQPAVLPRRRSCSCRSLPIAFGLSPCLR